MLARSKSKMLVRMAFVLAALSSSALAGDTNGWRNGGTGEALGVNPPIVGQADTTERWKTAANSWGNASPVRLGSLICITEEPVSVTCFDADSGTQRWTATNRYMDTLPVAERPKMDDLVKKLNADRARQDVIRAEMGQVQRELRRSTAGSDVQQRYDGLMAELNGIAERQQRHAAHILSDEHGIIGYATATPTVAGGHIYALFGNGVLSKFSEQGERKWSVWLGPPTRPMKGYHTGTSASPMMADGVLIAPFAQLQGVDPATGRVLWKASKYPHYGTPAIASVGGSSVVVTPEGELINPKDGSELGDPLASIEFIGPVAKGDKVYVIGHTRYPDNSVATHATGYQLSRLPNGRIESKQLWDRKLSKERTYASPAVSDERIYVLYKSGDVEVLSPRTGEQISVVEELPTARNGSPSVAMGGGKLLMTFEVGVFRTYTDADQPKPLGRGMIESHRATALLDGSRIYIRGFNHLYCIE